MSLIIDRSLSLIAAFSENYVIGQGLHIPWKIPGEQKRFKQLTTGNVVIMGRKTYDSIGRPLPNRQIIVISRNPTLKIQGVEVTSDLEQAIGNANPNCEIFIAGGGQLYRETIDIADTLYLTRIHAKIEGDVLFPKIPEGCFKRTHSNHVANSMIPYTEETWVRK